MIWWWWLDNHLPEIIDWRCPVYVKFIMKNNTIEIISFKIVIIHFFIQLWKVALNNYSRHVLNNVKYIKYPHSWYLSSILQIGWGYCKYNKYHHVLRMMLWNSSNRILACVIRRCRSGSTIYVFGSTQTWPRRRTFGDSTHFVVKISRKSETQSLPPARVIAIHCFKFIQISRNSWSF